MFDAHSCGYMLVCALRMLFYNLNNYAYNQNISADNYESPSEVVRPSILEIDDAGNRDLEIQINKT